MTATSPSVPSTTRRARFKAVSTRHGSGMRPCGCQLDNSSCRREDADMSATTRTITAPPSTAYKIVDVPELQRDVIKRYADRKSTRLNSSHSQISYAVFCLKKTKRYQSTL